MRRQYTIEGTYRDRSQADAPIVFSDVVEAKCAEHAFLVWESRHAQKPLLRFKAIEPLF